MKQAATIAEVLSIVGVTAGIMVGLLWLVFRLARGRWVSAPAEIVDEELRWMLPDGTVHSWTMEPPTSPTDAAPPFAAPADDADLEIHYRSHRPWQPHLEPVAHDEKALGLVTLLLLGVGVLSFVTSTVLGFVG